MAGDEERLVVMLEARVNQFEKSMQRAERSGSGSFRKLRGDSRSATLAMEQDMNRSTRSINQALATTSTKVGNFGKAFAGGMVAGLAAGVFASITSDLGAMARGIAEVGDEAKRSGLSVREFQEWKFVAEQNRIGMDALVDGFKELSLRADEFVVTGEGSAAEAFGRLGYTATEVAEKMKDPSALLLEIIGRMETLDKAAQIRIADELFGGTGGEQFVQLLEQGEKRIRNTKAEASALGTVMSDELIAKASELDRMFTTVASTVGTALKGAIIEAAYALADFIDGFRAFEDQRTSTLNTRRGEIEAELAARRQSLDQRPAARNGTPANRGRTQDANRIRELEEELGRVDSELATRTPILPYTPTPVLTTVTVPGSGAGGGGASKKSPYSDAVAGILKDTDALRAEAAVLAEVSAASTGYGDAIEYARVRADLLIAAQEQGLAITPELESQIDQLASAYTHAGQSADEAADRLEQMQERAQAGAAAVGGVFASVMNGSRTAAEALQDLLMQMAQAQMMKVFVMLGQGGGAGAGIFAAIGEALGYSSGGYTGAGGKYEPAGVVHKGEYVFDQDAVRRAGGPSQLDAMRSRLKGYSSGGYVGAAQAAPSRTAGASVQVLNYGSPTDVKADRPRGPNGEEMIRIIVKEQIRRGDHDASMGHRYGNKPKGVAR